MKIKLAENIRKFRKENSYTQEQLAEVLGVTVGAVYKWEAGLSMPEIRLLMMLADIFEVSVDVLLGYEQQNTNVEYSIARIEDDIRKKNFEEAVTEAEKALQKYPNHFEIVYVSGLLYQLKFIEEKEEASIERSNELLKRAITLLYQNTDKSISEVTILNLIAQNYLLAEKTEQALESLKQNNVCGINNSLIGMTYARILKQPENAKEYLMKSFTDCFGDMIRTMTGYFYMYEEQGNHKMSMEALNWLNDFLDSLKKEDAKNTFIDTIKAATLAQAAVVKAQMGKLETAKEYIRNAYILVKQFDAAPVYNLEGIKFFEGAEAEAVAYVDIGSTAMEAVENTLYEKAEDDKAYQYVCKLWEELKK